MRSKWNHRREALRTAPDYRIVMSREMTASVIAPSSGKFSSQASSPSRSPGFPLNTQFSGKPMQITKQQENIPWLPFQAEESYNHHKDKNCQKFPNGFQHLWMSLYDCLILFCVSREKWGFLSASGGDQLSRVRGSQEQKSDSEGPWKVTQNPPRGACIHTQRS